MQKFRYLLGLLCLAAMSATAAPGYTVTSFKIDAMKAPVVVQALDEWMASDTGKKYKGRLYLQAHSQDGADPSTHSIVSVYSSIAEADEFGQYVGGNEEALADWMKLIGKVSPISTQTFTGRFVHLASWGDVSDKDRVWMQHSISTQDAASVYRALDAWMKTDTGKKFPGQMMLGQTMAAGAGSGSHVVVIGFESLTEMEKWNEMVSGTAGLSSLLHTFSVINQYHGASISTDVKVWGKKLKSVIN